MPVKRKALAIVLIAIVALSLATWFIYSQIRELQNQIDELQAHHRNVDVARIVTVSNNTQWGNPVGMAMESWFTVTVRNDGSNTIEGLTLNLTISGVSDEIYDWWTSAPIGTIQSGKTSEAQISIILLNNGYENIDNVVGHNAVIQLILNDKILDTSTLTLG